MKKICLVAVITLFILQHSIAQDKSMFSREIFTSGVDTLVYRKLLPENFDPQKKYPVLIFLHGAGERGNDNEAQLIHGSKLFLRADIRRDFPAIIIFPQCPKNDFWANVKFGDGKSVERFGFQKGGEPGKSMKLLIGLHSYLVSLKYSDKSRFYIGGLSMGGMGTFEILRRKPKAFAAAFAICGGDNIKNVKKYKNVPLWIFHGGKDTTVPLSKSEVVVNELKRVNQQPKFTIYPEAGHNSWDPAFAEPEFISWIFSHKR
jgi:predicted peptidase